MNNRGEQDLKSKNTLSISVVVPCYNSVESIPELILRLENVLTEATENYEVILVNDGSSDKTWDIISEQSSLKPWIRGINLMRNYGQHNALLCGIRHAKNEIVVTLDDDLQNPPEEIPKLLEKINEGYEVVYGTQDKIHYGFFRSIATWLTKLVLKGTMGVENARSVSAFRAFRLDLRNAFADYRGSFVSIDVLLTWGTNSFIAVRVRHDQRTIGRSNYTLRKLLKHALDLMTGFSVIPLQFASMLGFVFTIFGIVILIYVLARYFIYGGVVQGFTFLASTIVIFSGAQLLALGIIGEYLARMHFRTMDKPTYTIKENT